METEERQGIAESFPRRNGENTLLLTSGVPVVGGVSLKAKVPVRGVAWYCSALETTPADRTHLWVALLNEAGEMVAVSLDYASAEHTPMVATKLRGLPFTALYEPAANERGRFVLLEAVSAGSPMTINTREGSALLEESPVLAGTLAGGATTPPALGTVEAVIGAFKLPYFVAV